MTLEELLAQLQLGQGDKDAARKQAIAQAGFALMGAPKGREWEAVGRAGFTGMGAYNNAIAGAQQGKMDGLKMRGEAMNMLAQQQQFNDSQLEREIAAGYQPSQMPQRPPMPDTSGVSDGLYDPAKAPQLAGMPKVANPEEQIRGQKPSQYEYYMGLAQAYKDKGLLKPAMQMEAQAAKYAPQPKELKDQKTLMHQGKRVTVNIYKDGSHEILPFDPDMEKAHFANVGDKVLAVDPMTGLPRGEGLTVNQSPDSKASTGVSWARLAWDKQKDARDQATGAAVNWVNDLERGIQIDPRTGQSRPIMAGNAPIGAKGESKKAEGAASAQSIIDLAGPLIDKATGSYAGAGIDQAAQVFGISTGGADANAQLKVLQARLMTEQPRMEGPQSDRDVQLYREAAGQIGDPTVPASRKKAALEMIKALNKRYMRGGQSSAGASGGWSITPAN